MKLEEVNILAPSDEKNSGTLNVEKYSRSDELLVDVLLQLGQGQPVAVPVCKGCIAVTFHR